jgi:simple sugar transport system permease protein
VGEVCGIQYRLKPGISPGYGYTAIVVALLGRLNPFSVILAAFFVSGLLVGGDAMQRAMGAPTALVDIVTMLILIFMLAGDTFMRYKIIISLRRK